MAYELRSSHRPSGLSVTLCVRACAQLASAADLVDAMGALQAQERSASEKAAAAEARCMEAERDFVRQRDASQALLERLLAEQRNQFEAESTALREQLHVANASEERRLEGLRAELAARAAQQEREARVETMRRQVTRRIMHRDLSRGWTAWTDLATSRADALRRLQRASSRLLKPDVSHAFARWLETWHDARYAKLATDAQAYAALEADLAAARAQLHEATAEVVSLRRQVDELDGVRTAAAAAATGIEPTPMTDAPHPRQGYTTVPLLRPPPRRSPSAAPDMPPPHIAILRRSGSACVGAADLPSRAPCASAQHPPSTHPHAPRPAIHSLCPYHSHTEVTVARTRSRRTPPPPSPFLARVHIHRASPRLHGSARPNRWRRGASASSCCAGR